jgi:hypothetical protein
MASGPSGWPLAQLFPRTLAEVPNGLLSDPILEMGVDAAEGEPLICARTCSFEVVVGKLTIVAMLIQYFDAVLIGKVLEGSLGVDSLL